MFTAKCSYPLMNFMHSLISFQIANSIVIARGYTIA